MSVIYQPRKQNKTECASCRFARYEGNNYGFKYECKHPVRDDDVNCPIDKYEIDGIYPVLE